jgi:transcriptional regulator with XRE-family HTH domain
MKRPKNAVGPQLMRVRSRLGLSQAQLAAKFQVAGWDVSRDIIARIELQTRCVSDIELIGLAHILRVSVDSLLSKSSRIASANRGRPRPPRS